MHWRSIASTCVLSAAACAAAMTVIERGHERRAEADIARLQRQMSAIAEANAGRPIIPASGRDPGAVPSAKSPDEVKNELQELFDRDPIDTTWDRTRTVEKLSAALPGGVTLGSVECRLAVCRIETVSKSPNMFNTFIHAASFGDKSIFAGQGINVVLSGVHDNPIRMATYGARVGTLPVAL